MTWAPLRHAVSRPLRGRVEIRALAEKSWELSPAVVESREAAVFDPAELDEVVGFGAHTSREAELARVRGGRVTHAATRVYRFRDALLAGTHLYVGSSREQIAAQNAVTWLPFRKVARVPRAMMCGSVVASIYFAHFVTDQLTAELLAAELGVPAYSAAQQVVYPHESAVRAATGLENHRAMRATFDELLLADDYGQNESKRRRYARIRSDLRAGARSRGGCGVFIRRGRSGSPRVLANEEQIAARLAREGFLVVDPDRDGLTEMRDALYDASMVIGVEGSALVHAIAMMPDRGRLLVVQPPDRFNNLHKDYTDCLGMRYGLTVADRAPGGFALPPERLLRAIDRLDRA